MKNLLLIFLLFTGSLLYSQCTINAGGNTTICGTAATLQGTAGTGNTGSPTWTLVSKPSGAPNPVITGANTLTPNVTGMTFPGNYVFQVEQNCTLGGSVTSQVTIAAPGATTGFTAGPDITNIPATTGIANLSATIPAGYTPSWTYYNINSFEVNGAIVLTNATMTGTTTATPTLTLTKKADHDIDPSYRVILRITSTVNPSCWYEDDAIVRFVPNPNVSFPNSRSFCGTPSVTASNRYFYDDNLSSPKFSDATTNASANPSWGTTITMNVISQPSGGNLAYGRIQNGRLYFASSFNQTVGPYVFTLTIFNSSGSYTTQQLTFNYNGSTPGPVSFVDATYPEQMALYSAGSTGGAVYCNRAGTTTPITFYFKLDPADSPTLTSTVLQSGITPTGGTPSIVENGAGSLNRSATLSPPSGGWRVGTYSFSVTLSNGTCNRAFTYYVHISDGNRPDVAVNNLTVCYPGSGVVSATIPLPAVYKGVVNPSYFQDYGGRYDLTVVSKPAGSATPTFDPVALRTFTNTSTVISNLNTQGEYVFKIKATPPNGGDPGFIAKEYACSGTSLEDTFSVFVSAQVGSNAGSVQTLIGTSQTNFNANNPGATATGAWILLTKPVGATDPVIATPSAYNTNVTGFNSTGTYTFRWTVTTGGTCTSTSDLTVNVINAVAGGVSGADFWVKSDDAGTIATAWKDHSANADNIPNIGGMTLSPADRAHNFNPYTTGYSASKYFYNTNSVLNTTNTFTDPSMRSSVSVFSAVRPTAANGTGRITGIDDDANASEPGISINSGMPHIYKYYGNGGAQANDNTMSAANSFTVNKSSVFSAIQDQALNSGRGERRLGLDGTYESFNLGNATNTFNVLGKHLRIGHGSWESVGDFPGDIMEILWFKRALTANEQSRVNSYLAVKNGTTLNENYLSTTSSIVWDRTNNTGYNNNIFGIARDNITALHQKQSGSTNIGQKLVISTTGFAASNSANATGLANDLQFLLTGDNGLKQSLTTPLSYTAGSNGPANYRFESIWKVQNTNSVGAVTVAWPKGVKNLYLVQSSDAVFDGTDTFTPMVTEVTVNGVVYNTVNVTLANGQFYTFAGFEQAPGGVAGPDFWVKSDDAGTISTAWKDHSANADNIPNVGGITLSPADRNHNFYPYTSGYTGAKLFYNDNSVLNTTNVFTDPSMRSSVSVFSAVRPTAANGTGRITGIDDDTNGSEPGVSINSGRPHIYKYYGNGTPQANSNTMSTANAFTVNRSSVFSAIQDQALNSGNGERRLGLDGIYESFNLGSTTNTFNVLGKHLRIGDAGWESSGPFPGDIMEVVWYKRALTANEQSRVNSYLAVKNGTTLNENYLSTNSTVVWDITNNAGYNNNIFGIAKDDFTALHQKQAGSVNNGQKLVISTTGFADSNAANSTGLANDLQFLLTGDNGLKQSLTTPLSYTAGSNGPANYRFESIWKAQNTNTVGTVTVAWPKSVQNLYLVQSSDAVFDGTDTFTPMATQVTVNSVVYNIANVTLTNGQFFTFAGFTQAPGGVLGPDFWVKSDDAGTISTAWKDHSINEDDIPNVGGITLSTADRNHNFYPYTTGYTAAKYFHNNTSVMNPLGNVELPNTNTSIFSAVRPTSVAAGRIIGIDDTTANAAEPGISSTSTGRPRQYEFFASTTSSDFSTAFNVGQSNIFSALANNTVANGGTSAIAGGEKRLGLNGTYESFSGFATTNRFQIYGTNLRLGYATWDVSGAFPGDIMEIAWYNRTLTANEQSRVNSYLAVKNGVTLNENYLSTNSSVVWDRTINTGYNNNIFGIAKDDFTALNQKQAGSVNNLQQLVISTIGFADSNAANSTGLTTDLQYLMTGDNGLEQRLKTPLVYTAGSNGVVSHRFESIWKAQNSGSVATVTVAWPKGVKNLYLVQSPDSIFDGTDTFTPMATETTVNGIVYNTANVTLGNGQYFTFAGFVENYCVTGDCNPNTFLNTSNPNTIEYDNMVSTFHSTMMRDASTGALKVWGERMANNGTGNLLIPTEVNSTNYPALTGDILKFTGGSNSINIVQSIVLTTDGLFAWGQEGVLISNNLTTNTTFQKIAVGTYGVAGVPKADGLPDGVAPEDVKMLFGTYNTLALTTCLGEAWVLSLENNLYGDNATDNATNDALWHRVHTNATTTLDNVVAVRGSGWKTFMALTATGEVYTWGTNTRLGDGSAAATTRVFATQMTLPAGVTPKMIGASGSSNVFTPTNYILGTNGNVYALGENSRKQLGNFTTTNSNSWVQVQKSATTGDYLTNVVWISPNEHDQSNYGSSPLYMSGSINVLTADGRLWAWGGNDGQMLGGSSTSPMDPTEMPGSIPSTDPYNIGKLNWTDKVTAVETGGHTSMIVKDNSKKYGYVGHRINGSMGDGTSVDATETTYNFASTPEINLCGAPVLLGSCYKPGITAGTALDTKVGITALNRAGATDSDNWPMTRKGGWLALEAKTKGFVPNRVAFNALGNPIGIPAANFVEGMMVYDTINKCMKMYTSTDGGTTFAWYCISTQTCPD